MRSSIAIVVFGWLAALLAVSAVVLHARAVVVDGPSGDPGLEETFYGLCLGIAAGVAVAATIGAATRSVGFGLLALFIAPLAVPATCLSLDETAATVLAPWLCGWPSRSGGLCANCARLLDTPVAACGP